jgi:hypothetical protein
MSTVKWMMEKLQTKGYSKLQENIHNFMYAL